MKTITYLFAIIFSSMLILPNNSYSQILNYKINDERIREDDPNYKIERQKWMDEMHNAAPDVNWRAIDNRIREQRRQLRQEKIQALLNHKTKIEEIQSDTVADGKLIGEWIERGSNNLAGRMLTCDIDFENNLIYNASSGGNIWRGDLDGNDWTCLNNGYKIGGVIFLKVVPNGNSKRIILATGKRVLFTDNEGIIWQTASGLSSLKKNRRVLMVNDENHTIYFLGYETYNKKTVASIYKSTDLGETFTSVYKTAVGSSFTDLWTPRYDGNDLYFLHNDSLSKINANGSIQLVSLVDVDTKISDSKQQRLRGNSKDNKTKLYLYRQLKNGHAQFYSSTDLGKNWDKLGTLSYGPFSINSFEVSSVDPDALFFGGVEVSRSYDGGKTWNVVNKWGQYYADMENKLHADIPSIASFRDNDGKEIIIVGTDGGAFESYDKLKTVKNISMQNLNVSQYYSSYSYHEDPDKIFVGAQDQGFQRTIFIANDGTHSFQQTISGDYAHLTSSDGGKTVWCVYPGFTMLYTDLADPSKTRRYARDFEGNGGLWLRPLLADPNNPDIAYLAGGGTDGYNHIWKLTFKGGTISSEEMPFQFNNKNAVSALGISNLNKQLFYAMTKNGDFYYSTDLGKNWTKTEDFKGLGGHYFYGESVVPSNVDTNKVYIAGSGYSNPGVYVSTNHGQSFTPIDSGLPNTLVYRIAVSENDEYIFAATAVGPYVYISSEGVWYDMGDIHAPDQTYWSVEYIPELMTARFCTYGRGIWDFRIENAQRIKEVALLEPENKSENISLDTTLVWTKSENADHYEIQVAEDLLFQKVILENYDYKDTTFEVSGLVPNKMYFWRVKAVKDKYISSWSNIYTFTTLLIMPFTPELNYPEDKQIQVELLPQFEWQEVPYSYYHFQLATDKSFDEADILVDKNNIIMNSYSLNFYLKNGVTYYWRVRAENTAGISDYSEYYTFTTARSLPNQPILEYPPNGSNKIPLNVTLQWDEVENTDYYTLNVATDNQFNNIIIDKDSIYSNSYKVNTLLDKVKMYLWRVKANNISGSGDWSDFRMFITGTELGVNENNSINKYFKIIPNPFSEKTSINFELSKQSKIKIDLYDILGNEIMNIYKGNLQKGVYSFTLKSSDFQIYKSAGVFLLKLQIDNKVFLRKITYIP